MEQYCGEGLLALGERPTAMAARGWHRCGLGARRAAEQRRRSSVTRARARGGERARGLCRGGEAVQERRACGSEGAAQEWRRRTGAGCRAAVSRGGRGTGVRLTRGPAEGLSENRTDGPANPKHRKVRWCREKTVGVITGVSLTRSERD